MKIRLIFMAGLLAITVSAQAYQSSIGTSSIIYNDTLKEAPSNWFHLDPEKDNMNGVSSNRAYEELLKGKKSKTVIVAVIDSGIDVDHEDLKDNIWVNEGEIAGNGIDDDKNGYTDDIHGWNFIGGTEGNVEKDTYEITREYGRLLRKYDGMSDADKEADNEYAYFSRIEKEYTRTVSEMEANYERFKGFYKQYLNSKKLMEAYIGTEELNLSHLQSVRSPDERVLAAKQIMQYVFENNIDEIGLEKGNEYYDVGLNYGYNLSYNPRNIVGDNYDDQNERYYGNNDVKGDFNFHGTHVAGIIAASRTNSLGIEGVADNVKIMVLRAVPNGDERDKDIANAIIYAVDNGARVINMSFGKSFSPQKDAVDKAVKYAEENNVLLVHAAGNSSKNIDVKDNFPTKTYENGKTAGNWLEVGALNWKSGNEIVAEFSNYGQTSVDVFAPGVDIFSTAPDQEYEDSSGTSMAAPVTSGVAAMLISYYPTLTAEQVRLIIAQSAYDLGKTKVIKPGSEDEVNFSTLSKTGGVVNAYKAIELAEKVVKNKKKLKAY